MTASSIRSGHPETCFQHAHLAAALRPSEKLKEDLLAAYAEVDQIDMNLEKELSSNDLEYLAGRLVTIQDFNNALADYIVKKVSYGFQRQMNREDFPSEEKYRENHIGVDYQRDKLLDQVDRANAYEEIFVLQQLGPFSEQLSAKVARVFQKTPLVGFQAQATPPVSIQKDMPIMFRIYWKTATIEEEKSNHLNTTSSIASSASLSGSASSSAPVLAPEAILPSTPDSSSSVLEVETVSHVALTTQPAATARIVVSYEGGEGDKLYIRGTGPNMSWGPGIELRKEGSQWIYESTELFETFEFKLALNDQVWEAGDNHTVESGKPVEISSVVFHPPA